MAYKKLTRRSYKIIKTTIWLLPVVNSSTCKSWSITKYDHCIHHIYHHTYHILWQYHITNTLCKNKLDVSNLLIAYFTWLMGATLKNGSYLPKATMLNLEFPKSCWKSDDNYSWRNRHLPAAWVEQATRQVRSRSHERGPIKLACATSIPLCCDIKKYIKEACTKNINVCNNIVVFYSCTISADRSRSDTTEGFRSIENKNFLQRRTRTRQDLIYEIQNNERGNRIYIPL
jgi:hypothetical protein